ncbi:sensor domain-containing diguanylate cyclase [Agitococcus lubricus]|uniref:PAS domain S-box-containing protein/diguanylate cyclase (GGDEF)-like protein n=1 Tax=Agitococcus lubricus TaxID=1077255 RepID=A0A2T5IYX0_9GAMM|nr:diguanylate cyclase [Agitococcus lubricus]PTQ89209.1 PAS domain S-box-containing protein/diguanylate cyclase (GGDEF)-like protein [Agitococcus lubricus]
MSDHHLENFQTWAVIAVLQGTPLEEVAIKARVSEETLKHWLKALTEEAQHHLAADNLALELPVRDLAHALDNIGAYVFIKDLNGCYTYANRLVRELFSKNLIDIIGHTDHDFFSQDTVNDIEQHDQQVLREGITIRAEEHLRPVDGHELRIYWTVKIPLFDESGHIRGLCGISTDITERKQMEQALRDNQALLSTVLDNIGACVYMKAPDGRYLYANAAMAALLNRRPEQLIGRVDSDLFPQNTADHFAKLDQLAFTSQQKVAGMETFQLHHHEPLYYWSVKVPLQRDNGDMYALLGMSTDITERKRLEDELLRLATTDELTHLYNRRHFLTLSEQTLNRSRRYHEPLALLMCDIDFFKHINDTFGHAMGDLVLQQVAEIIKNTLRDTDIAGRIGGEEFAILLVQTRMEHAQEVAERLKTNIANSEIYLDDGHKVPLTISIGVATPVYPMETLATLLQHADQALYAAKRLGRNRVHLATEV